MNRSAAPKRLDRAALFRAIGYVPHEGQLPIHRSKARFRVVCCGTRFGKTSLAVAEAVAALLEPRKHSLGWTVAPTLDLARLVFDRVAAEFQAHFPHRVKDVSLREQRLVVVNLGGGLSELRGKTSDNPASLLGASVDWIVIDEATRMKREIWENYLSPRLIDRRGWALLVSTPSGRDWFARLHRRGQKGRDVEYESWSMPTWINPHLQREVIEAERKRLTKDSFDAQYGAEFQGDDLEPCDLCGGPDPNASGLVLVHEGEAEPAPCADCEQLVDVDGRTVVKLYDNGMRECSIITLESRSDGTTCVPERATAFDPKLEGTLTDNDLVIDPDD